MNMMTPMLAEASNSFMGQFVYAGLALLAGVAGGVAIMSFLRKPDPTVIEQPVATTIEGEVVVRKTDRFATREFIEAQHCEVVRRLSGHDQEILRLRQDMDVDRRNNEIHASTRSRAIYDKIDHVRQELSEKIDNMPDRVIDTLSKLNLLKKPHE